MTIPKESIEAAARLIAGRQCTKWVYGAQVDSCIKTDPSCACRQEAQKCFDVALPHLAQSSKSDEERARDLEKYGRYSTKGDSEEMVAVYLRALTAVRAEASAAKDAEIECLAAQDREIAEAYRYATVFLHAFCENNSLRQVEPLPTICGVLTQIDNATTIIRAKDAEIAALREALEAIPALTQEHGGAAKAIKLCRAALEMSGGVK